jgi:hypothetical protein
MTLKLTESFTYPGVGVEAVYALITNEGFREEAAGSTGGTDIEITLEESEGGGHVVTILRNQPADMPDSIKKFVGDSVKIKQTERWGGADADGNRSAEVKMSVIGQPAGMTGTVTLSGADDVTFAIDGKVKVDVPFFGGKIEPVIAKVITAAVRNDVELGNQRLAENA